MNGDRGRLERRVAQLEEKERSNKTIVAALRGIDTKLGRIVDAIRHSKGDMTAEQEQAFMAKTAGEITKNTGEILDAQKDDKTTTQEK